ncbi:NDR1/HIN1-like protein 10 [Arachis duranensis]|uniref:NDR1/HIN1-like protein 10 n=1 Tax=Arachis duranensis TaxID=130453 RepID=A0A6P4CB32_ARADU|nr:NDR1/HIN1-like protein 10 [Arachis duranensis]
MLSLPPLPPPPQLSPPPRKQSKPISLDQIVISTKQTRNQNSIETSAPNSVTTKLIRPPTTPLRQPQPKRTNPIIWFTAVLCLIFSLVLIFFGIATLIIFLIIKPRTPIFDIPNANLNLVYFDSPNYINGDFTLLANFTNPNKKINVLFESLDVELFFSERLISAQSIEPFAQRRRESKLQSVNFISSLVFLPQDIGVKLQKQVQNNRVIYNVKGTFRVKITIGLIHVSYWLHSRCQIEMTGPPTGVLVARNCITKR